FTAVFIATMIFAMIGSLLLNPVVFAAGGGGPAVPDSVPELDVEENSEDGSEFDPVLSETKPDVAEVPVNNQPNRIITTINGDTSRQIGFSCSHATFLKTPKVGCLIRVNSMMPWNLMQKQKKSLQAVVNVTKMETIYSPKWRKMQKASLLKMEMASLSSTAT